MSATSSVSTSGVLVTVTPCFFAASTSTVSTPTPKCEMIFTFGSFAIVAASMPFLPEVATAVMRPATAAIIASLSGASQSLCSVNDSSICFWVGGYIGPIWRTSGFMYAYSCMATIRNSTRSMRPRRECRPGPFTRKLDSAHLRYAIGKSTREIPHVPSASRQCRRALCLAPGRVRCQRPVGHAVHAADRRHDAHRRTRRVRLDSNGGRLGTSLSFEGDLGVDDKKTRADLRPFLAHQSDTTASKRRTSRSSATAHARSPAPSTGASKPSR